MKKLYNIIFIITLYCVITVLNGNTFLSAIFCLYLLQVKEDTHLDSQRVVTVVESLLVQFSERKQLISEYYEHWKVYVNTGKEFKSQWAQFIKDARKVRKYLKK